MKLVQYDEQAVQDILELRSGSVEQTLKTLNDRTLEPFTLRHWEDLDRKPLKDSAFAEALTDDTVDQEVCFFWF